MRMYSLRSTMFAAGALGLAVAPAGCDFAQLQAEAKIAQGIALAACNFEPALPMLIDLINAGAGQTADEIAKTACGMVKVLPQSRLRSISRRAVVNTTAQFNGYSIRVEGRFVR